MVRGAPNVKSLTRGVGGGGGGAGRAHRERKWCKNTDEKGRERYSPSMPVMRKRKDRKREKKKKKRKRKAVCRHLTRPDQTRQVGRQAEGGRHQPTSSGRCCQTDMARCRRSSIH